MSGHWMVVLLVLCAWGRHAQCESEAAEGSEYPRQVVKVLTVSNGVEWGKWERKQFCPTGTYATGYSIKLEPSRWIRGDDTSLNSIELQCSKPGTQELYGTVNSEAGPWGIWSPMKNCLASINHQFFLTSFQLKVEQKRGFGDDTGVNNVRFKCRLLRMPRDYMVEMRGGAWGHYGLWSESCPLGTAICGIQVKMDAPRGQGDDKALTDVRMFCCKDFKVTLSCAHSYD